MKSEKWHVGQRIRWKTVDEVPTGNARFVFMQVMGYPGTLTVARLVKSPQGSEDEIHLHISHNGEVIRNADNKPSQFSPFWLAPC